MLGNYIDPETLLKISNSFSIIKFLEMFEDQINSILGVRKVPLVYVLRKIFYRPNIQNCPLDRENPAPYSSNYEGFYDKLTTKSIHSDPILRWTT